uniref:Uncharacterized protein n=1 Tax=Chenopodium quinoa TaxID=63459 RepID=A0A803KVQ4_CHEQI
MGGGGAKEEEQDGMSVHSPCKAPPSSASSLSKEQSQAELELRFLEALEIYPPGKLKGMCRLLWWLGILGIDNGDVVDMDTFAGGYGELGWGCRGWVVGVDQRSGGERFSASGIHRHFVLYGVMEFLRRSFDRQFSSEEVMRLLDRFYNLEMLRGDDEDAEFPHCEEEFSLPQSYFAKDES